jgi:MFS family permease
MALIATAVAFSVITSNMQQLGDQFELNNTQRGWIGGVTMWGFTVSIVILGPLCDALGMRFLMRFAFVCHFVGVSLMVFANGFWMLFIGGFVIALGNGTVEAACNPLTATIFPDRKTEKLNHFHMWWPGGLVLGGVAAFFIDKAMPEGTMLWQFASWQVKLALVLIPAIVYGALFTGQKFPLTERVQSGVTFGGMFKATFLRPLYMLLFFCMMLTASMELGPGRWMSQAMEKAMDFMGKSSGILVLVWISGLMAILRGRAGVVVHKLSNTGLLLVSSILGGAGLLALTYAEGPVMVGISATVFAVGVCYFWPTMLGTVAERVPKGGALALGVMGGAGMAIVGLVTAPLMGKVADDYVLRQLSQDKARACLVKLVAMPADEKAKIKEKDKEILDKAIKDANDLLTKSTGAALPLTDAAEVLRGAKKVAYDESKVDAAAKQAGKTAPEVCKEAKDMIDPLDEAGSRLSFRWVSATAIPLIIVFGALFISDRARGGHRKLAADHAAGMSGGGEKKS